MTQRKPVTRPARGAPASADGGAHPANRGRSHAPELLVSIGSHLRAARLERKLTLQQAAAAAGLTKGFLSQLERGESSASITSLLALCAALDLNIAALFEPAATTVAHDPVVRFADRDQLYLGGEGVTDFLISPAHDRRFEVFETHIEPLGSPGDELYSLDSEFGFACVLRGRLEFRAGTSVHILQAGDTLTYSPREPHTFRNPSASRRAVVIFMNSPAVF
jgi:transcriptional regulator with XRE-family HTH domain